MESLDRAKEALNSFAFETDTLKRSILKVEKDVVNDERLIRDAIDMVNLIFT
jgi:hypothetical protein